MRTLYCTSALILLAAVALAAQIPENQEVRSRYRELILGPPAEAASAPSAVLSQSSGPRVQFRMERQNGSLYYLFLNEASSSFPVAGGGNWIIKRELSGGEFVQAKIYYREHPGCFLRLFPAGSRTTMDVYLFGIAVDRKVQLPLAFGALLAEPFSRLQQLTRSTVRWDLLLYRGERQADRRIEEAVRRIASRLGSLREAEDGAIDAQGRYVRIADLQPQDGGAGAAGGLNCSGFAKWIVDGFVFPLAGRLLDIPPLKERHLELRGNRWSRRYEEARDPYFGLDWSRNLAAGLRRAQGLPELGPEGSDVRQLEYLSYREDVGFPVEELELVLYLASRRSPGSLYLGSLNRELGSEPPLRQHYHLVVLAPRFNEEGEFRVTVFDLTSEASLEDIGRRFAGHYIHLVRLSALEQWAGPGS